MNKLPTPEEGGAAFNIGLSTAIEIRNLLNECNITSRTGKFTEWYGTLLAIEREVTPEFREKDDDNIKRMRPDLIIKLDNWQKCNNALNQNRVFSALHMYEIELRKIIKRRGLGMPDKEDDDGL